MFLQGSAQHIEFAQDWAWGLGICCCEIVCVFCCLECEIVFVVFDENLFAMFLTKPHHETLSDLLKCPQIFSDISCTSRKNAVY